MENFSKVRLELEKRRGLSSGIASHFRDFKLICIMLYVVIIRLQAISTYLAKEGGGGGGGGERGRIRALPL